MKRLFKNDGTLLFGYWIREHWKDVPASYLRWACENVPDFDLQLERLKQGLDPIPGIRDGTKAIPVERPPVRKTFVSKQVRPMNHTPHQPTQVDLPATPQDELAQCIANGLSRKELAKLFGISLYMLDKRIRERGLPKPTNGRKFNDPGTALRMRAAEARAKKAAERHEAVAHNAGILQIRNGRIRWTKEADDAIIELMDEFKCWDEVAKVIGFKPGGKVLCHRYCAHRSLPRYVAGRSRKTDDCVDKTLDPKQPRMPKRRNLFRRIWDAFFNPL